MPDAELSALADAGKLHEPEVLRAQVKRLLADARSRALFDGFGVHWLGIADLDTKTLDPAKFPQMTAEMRAATYDEARLFFDCNRICYVTREAGGSCGLGYSTRDHSADGAGTS